MRQVVVYAPGKGIFRVTPQAFQQWHNAPKSVGKEMSWYGLANMNLLPAGEYTPSPPQPVMNLIQALVTRPKGGMPWNLERLEEPFVWFYNTQIKILNDWFSHTNIPQPYAGFSMDVRKLEQATAVDPRLEATLIHLIGCCVYAVKEVVTANGHDHRKAWEAYPPDWGQPTHHQVDGHYADVLRIANQLPALRARALPPDDVIAIMIQFDKETSKEHGDKSPNDNYFTPAPRNNEKYNTKVLSAGAKTRITKYFQETYPLYSKQAASISTGETLPFYQWQGAFIASTMKKVKNALPQNQIWNKSAWKALWPVRDPTTITVPISFGGYDKVIYPPRFWPIPPPETIRWLDEFAVLPGANTKSGGKKVVSVHDANVIRSCCLPDGWLDIPEASKIDISNIESGPSKQGFQKVLPMLFAYAVALRSFKAGRGDSEWKWQQDGQLVHAKPVDRFRSCVFLKNHPDAKVNSKYLNAEDNNPNCLATQIVGWEEPWTLPKEELREFLKSAAPMPLLRDPKPGEKTEDYQNKFEASKGGYQQWFNMIMEKPLVLKEFPIGVRMGTVAGTDVPILNLFPNYGLWYSATEDSFLHHLLNPYHDLMGEYLIDEIMNLGRKQLAFLKEQFEKVRDTAIETVDAAGEQLGKTLTQDLMFPAVVFGGLVAGLMITYSLTVK